MKHPPYHLRINKHVDRNIFIELIKIYVENFPKFKIGEYYTLGGPFLEDCKAIATSFPFFKIFSIEKNKHTLLRAQFHACSSNISVIKFDIEQYLVEFNPVSPFIFWLDHNKLSSSEINQLSTLCLLAPTGSIVRFSAPISYNELKDSQQLYDDYSNEFGDIYPVDSELPFMKFNEYCKLIQDMIQTSIESVFQTNDRQPMPISINRYSDGTTMISITFCIIDQTHVAEVRKVYKDWPFKKLDWGVPYHISMPHLSIKERLHLEQFLPEFANNPSKLLEELGYKIDDSRNGSKKMLKQYSEYESFYPKFARVAF